MTHFLSLFARKTKPVQREQLCWESQLGTVGNIWELQGVWVHSHNLSHFYMLLLEAPGPQRTGWGLVLLPTAPPPLHRAYNQKILIRFGSQLHIFPFSDSKALAWPFFASVFPPVPWTQFISPSSQHCYKSSIHESTLQHEEFMKTEKLLVFKHNTLTPPPVSRDCKIWEPQPPR